MGVLAVAGVIPKSPNTASAMRAGTAKSVAIGEIGACGTAAVVRAALLSVAAAGTTVVVPGAVSAATGVVASAVTTGLAGAESLDLLITGAGDAVGNDATVGFLSGAAVRLDGEVRVDVAGVEVLAESVSADGALSPGMLSRPATDSCPLVEVSVLVAEESALAGFAFGR